jgi:BASS family bile acid:Na+ symporter
MEYTHELNLTTSNIVTIKAFLGFMMFILAQDIQVHELKKSWSRSLVLGGIGQLFLLPFITFLVVSAVDFEPQLALGFIVVAACPGGNLSNLMSFLSHSNVALSVSLTILSTIACLFMTPFNIFFWGSMASNSSVALQQVQMDAQDILMTLLFVIVIPLFLGIWVRKNFEKIALKSVDIFRKISIFIILAFMIVMLQKNAEGFLYYTGKVLPYVIGHNLLAIFIGWLLGTVFKTGVKNRRTLMIEISIQNSGLGLGLILTFFPQMIGTAIVAAYWGIWHLIAGLIMVGIWRFIDSRNNVAEEVSESLEYQT